MIRRKGECQTEIRERMRDGEGKVKIEHLWKPKEELKANTRLFAKLTLEPGSSIGFHTHDKEEEIYLILKGRAELDDNGEKSELGPGDSILTGGGAGHSIKSLGPDTLEVMAVINCY